MVPPDRRATCGSAGSYQLEGNAGGEVQECAPPDGGAAHYRITWAYGGGGDLGHRPPRRVSATTRPRVELEHIAKVADVPAGFWDQFGPGATGVGWDGGLLGLALHLGDRGPTVRPRGRRMAWMMTRRGQGLLPRRRRRAGRAAHVADGGDPDAAPAAADATFALLHRPGPDGCRRTETLTKADVIPHMRGGGDIVEADGGAGAPRGQRRTRPMTLFDGITARVVETPRLSVNILERDGDDPSTPPERTVVFIHGNVSSSLFWQELMQDLPSDLRVIAIDLRGFGDTEHAPVDATRGVRDFSDDVARDARRPRHPDRAPRRAGRWAAASSCSTRSITPR